MAFNGFKPFDVVVVPFPFTDGPKSKRRPAMVLSSSNFSEKIGHSLMAMITSAKNVPWPLDVPIRDLKKAGLPSESVVRMKLFTLDHRFVIRIIGTLAESDQRAIKKSLSLLLARVLI